MAYTGGRWFCSLQVEVRREAGRPAHVARIGTTVGVDVGVTYLAVLSTGEQVPNPAPLRAALRRLAKAQRIAARRIGPYDTATRGRRAPSNRWRRAQQRVGRLHGLVAAARVDVWHRLTTRLAQGYDRIVVEDLNVAGMLRNRRLARAVCDASPAVLRRHLAYKTGWYCSVLHVAVRWYPSSKTCSGCQAVKPKLPLSERTFVCDLCGMVLDRDLNAARNLAALVRHVDLELLGDAKTGRGACGRPAPSGGAAGREASRPRQVVNVSRQRATTDHELTHAS